MGTIMGIRRGGGSGCTLTVTGVANDTATLTKGSKTYTKTFDSSGKAVFKGLSSGTWTAGMSNGTESTSRNVNIVADYAVTLAYFSATITVTYPANSTCTCSDGITTLTDTNTGATEKTVIFTVPNTGTWTVNCTDGDKTKSATVSITTDGQAENVTLTYELYLYDAGNEYTSTTGGWSLAESNGDLSGESLDKNTNNMMFSSSYVHGSHFANGFLCPVNAIDLTSYNLMRIHLTSPAIDPAVSLRFGCSPSRINDAYSKMTAFTQIQTASGDVVVDCDIANVSKSMYIGVAAEGTSNGASSCTVTKVLLL